MSDLGSLLPPGLAMLPALSALDVASMLCGAATGRQEDVFSWLAADQQLAPATSAACDDSEFLGMCAAFGLLACP
jgi:hypothetical protein